MIGTALKKDVKPVYATATVAAADVAFEESEEKWDGQYPAMIRL